MTVKDILGDENGFDALQASDDGFNQKLILIKKQLEQRDHPINELVRQFDRVFFHAYSKEIEKGIKNPKDMNPDYMPKVIAEVQNWVRIIFFSVLKFYRINLQSPEGSFNCDFKKDLLLNMITSIVMMDQTYSIIMNSILQASAGRVKQI